MVGWAVGGGFGLVGRCRLVGSVGGLGGRVGQWLASLYLLHAVVIKKIKIDYILGSKINKIVHYEQN